MTSTRALRTAAIAMIAMVLAVVIATVSGVTPSVAAAMVFIPAALAVLHPVNAGPASHGARRH